MLHLTNATVFAVYIIKKIHGPRNYTNSTEELLLTITARKLITD
jgi:hypothetical protein